MEALEILKKCTVEGNVVKLPRVYIDRWNFIVVKEKIEAVGGKWDGVDVNGFVFEAGAEEALAKAIQSKTVLR